MRFFFVFFNFGNVLGSFVLKKMLFRYYCTLRIKNPNNWFQHGKDGKVMILFSDKESSIFAVDIVLEMLIQLLKIVTMLCFTLINKMYFHEHLSTFVNRMKACLLVSKWKVFFLIYFDCIAKLIHFSTKAVNLFFVGEETPAKCWEMRRLAWNFHLHLSFEKVKKICWSWYTFSKNCQKLNGTHT